jgi:large subunit ribosomal protein L15
MTMAELGLHTLRPDPGSTGDVKRRGRGKGTGQGKTGGRGHKGYNARSGGGVRPGYEGGQMPLYMRLGKLRGPHMKKSMPIGPFRTYLVPVNVGRLAKSFAAGAEVTPEALVAKRIVKNTRTPIKILGGGDIDVALTVRMHAYSQKAAEKIAAAGGTAELL